MLLRGDRLQKEVGLFVCYWRLNLLLCIRYSWPFFKENHLAICDVHKIEFETTPSLENDVLKSKEECDILILKCINDK